MTKQPPLPPAMKQMSARVPTFLARRIKIQAIREGKTTQALIAAIIESYLKSAEEK